MHRRLSCPPENPTTVNMEPLKKRPYTASAKKFIFIAILSFVAGIFLTVKYNGNPPGNRNAYDEHIFDICVVGAGLSGAVISERYANKLDKTVLIMEKRDHIGGNVFDYIDEETGIRVNKYGAHLFHTRSERVWDYMQTWSKWTKWEHKVLGMAGDKYFPIPVNIETVNVLFDENIQNPKQMDAWLAKEQVSYERDPQNSEEMALSRVGQRLYDIIFKPYTIKQWDKQPSQLGPEVTARIPIRNDFDDRYFSDPYQALPSDGYTAIFERMFDNSLITVRLNTDYFDVRDKIRCGKTYFTGPVDAYYAHLGWDKLEYRSIDFERQVIRNTEFFQPAAVVNHPTPEVDYTRIVEYKHFLNQASPDTVIFYERSMDIGDPYYPVPNHRNKALYEKYKTMAVKEYNVKFVGRLANYKYFNMDESILNALQLFDKETSRPFWKKGFPWADSKRI